MLLLGRGDWLRFGAPTRALSRIGDWSYSIYLVHWPLYAFATHVFVGVVPTSLALAFIPASVALGYLQYRLVEQPFRFATSRPRQGFLSYAAGTALVICAPAAAYFSQSSAAVGEIDFAQVRRENTGLSSAC